MSVARIALALCAAALPALVLTVAPASAQALAQALADPVIAPSVAASAGPLVLPLPTPLPPVRGLTLLIMIHILGVCFGLGGATMLDFWIVRWLRWGGLPGEIARTFGYVSKVCSVGLLLLWVSGLGFLAIYALESPEKLSNPKLWAKVTVVLALTFNGIVIHHTILPGILRDVSRPMFEGLTGLRAGIFLTSGAISGISWYTAFALGVMKELNGTVAYGLLVGLWLATIAAASLGGLTVLLVLRDGRIFRRRIPGPVSLPLPSPISLAIPAAIPIPIPVPRPLPVFSEEPTARRIPRSRFVRIGAGLARP